MGSYTLIGRVDEVDVLHRGGLRTAELSAVGEIAAPATIVHERLLAYTDPRVIASYAEGWVAGICPPMSDFKLRARWTSSGMSCLSFRALDDRGLTTRRQNWVVEASGSWTFAPIEDALWTRAIYRVRIELAGFASRWTVRNGARNDVPTLFQILRALVGDQRRLRSAV